MIKPFFIQELKRSVSNKYFFISLILNTLLMIFPFIGNNYGSYIYESQSNPINVFLTPYIATNAILPLFIMFTAPLAFASSYANEFNTNFPDLIYTRITKTKYHLIKYLLSGFSGLMAVLLPSLVLFFLTIIVNIKDIRPSISGDSIITERAFSNIALNHPILLCALVVLFTLISSWIFSIYGYLASLVIKKQWIAIVFPFSFFLVLGTFAISFGIENYLSFINMIIFYFFPISEMAFFIKYLVHIVFQLLVLWILLRFKEDI